MIQPLPQDILADLRANAEDSWPNDKDLCRPTLSLSVCHDLKNNKTYYLLFDDKGYITYTHSIDVIDLCLSGPPLRQALSAKEWPFKSRHQSKPSLSYEDLF
jgi:hypothetical protein